MRELLLEQRFLRSVHRLFRFCELGVPKKIVAKEICILVDLFVANHAKILKQAAKEYVHSRRTQSSNKGDES